MRTSIGVLTVVLASGCLIRREPLTPAGADAATDVAVEIGTPSDTPDASPCEGTLPLFCGGVCFEGANDDDHCGGCDTQCEGDARCVEGRCTCDLEVYSGCEPGLRIWLDAQNTTGAGTSPDGALTTWFNLAESESGDAMHVGGNVMALAGIEGQRTVRFSDGSMRTTGALARANNTHMEVFVVARSRDITERGFTIGTADSPPNRFSVFLPWTDASIANAYFDFPFDSGEPNGRMQLPFTRSPRHITLWHAFQGNSGGEVRVGGVLVARNPGLSSASRDFTQPLSIGGVGGSEQSLDLHELLVFDQELSEAARTRITRALNARWHLNDAPALPAENMHVHLDAMQPLATPGGPSDGMLPVWVDQSPAHRDAATVGVRWRADGLGTGFPSVRLRTNAIDTNSSHVDVARPSEPFTAFLVMATEDGRGTRIPMQCPSLLATESESTDSDGGLLLCGGRPAFFRGNGADNTGATLSPHRIDDGRRHLLIVRRESGGATTVTIDHEIVIQGNFGGSISASQWLIGRHDGNDRNGTLQADLGELLVYSTALDDDTLNQIERTLRAKWQTPVYSRAPWVSPCELGRQAACPFTSLAETRSAPSGTYWLKLGTYPPFRVSVDASEGGGWALILQYVRQAGAPAQPRVIQPGFDWPLLDDARLGVGAQRASDRWGHVGADIAALLTGATELRWYGTTSGHPRILHFSSTQGVDTWIARRADSFGGVRTTFTPLTGHSTTLPASANSSSGNNDVILTEFPFFQAGVAHWSAGGSNRWELDDYPGNASNATIHRLWVR